MVFFSPSNHDLDFFPLNLVRAKCLSFSKSLWSLLELGVFLFSLKVLCPSVDSEICFRACSWQPTASFGGVVRGGP